MRKLLSFGELSPEKRELIQEVMLSPADKNRLSGIAADALTIDVTQEMILQICEQTEFPSDFTNLERILWTSRGTYLLGYRAALDMYSRAIEEILREVTS